MIENHGRNHREELLFNSSGSVQKTLYSISQEATPDQIKDILLRNHSNLKTPSQCTAAYQSTQQKPDEALQTYNTDISHITSWLTQASTSTMTLQELVVSTTLTLHGKLGKEMEGRFNQELPDNLWSAFEKAVNLSQGSSQSNA